MVAVSWRRAWDKVIRFFAFAPGLRQLICTINAIESVNARLRKIVKSWGHFPGDDVATTLIWLARRNITADGGPRCQQLKASNESVRYSL